MSQPSFPFAVQAPPTAAEQQARHGTGDLWVFAYGSLMWQPDIPFVERCSALLYGWHRALCILSIHYRGTPTNPGLVLGLDRGGACRGIAYRIAAHDRAAAVATLDARELPTRCYIPRFARLYLADQRCVEGYLYTADRLHPQYAGALSAEHRLTMLRHGRGERGTSRDYLAQTVSHLTALGMKNSTLHRLLKVVDSGETFSGSRGP